MQLTVLHKRWILLPAQYYLTLISMAEFVNGTI